ncbi:MAG: hypothetical protein ACRDXB_04965, partial [Actinomycetes bacterium]
MYKRVVIGLVALALLVGAGVAGVAAWRFLDRTPFEDAVASMPADTLRATFTDWSEVRARADGGSLDAGSSSRSVDQFLDRAFEIDLVSTSAVSGSTYALERRFGFSPLGATWEMYGQSREGAVDALRMDESVDLGGVEQSLRQLGYTEPSSGEGSGGVWAGSADLVAQIDPTLSSVMQNIVVMEDERLVLMSDSPSYASLAADAVDDAGSSLASEPGVSSLSRLASSPVSAVLYGSDFACEALSMSSADEEDQRVADEMVAAAGGVAPLSGMVMAHQPDRSLVVVMQFEDSDQAAGDLAARVELATGDAIGQGGSFADRFQVSSAETDGDNVVLTLEPVGSAEERAES